MVVTDCEIVWHPPLKDLESERENKAKGKEKSRRKQSALIPCENLRKKIMYCINQKRIYKSLFISIYY